VVDQRDLPWVGSAIETGPPMGAWFSGGGRSVGDFGAIESGPAWAETLPGNDEGPPFREAPRSKSLGSDLLSHPVSRAVPSALEGLTSGFGMGPGVPPPLWPPKRRSRGADPATLVAAEADLSRGWRGARAPSRMTEWTREPNSEREHQSQALGLLVPVG
jgi:hypothetical protein